LPGQACQGLRPGQRVGDPGRQVAWQDAGCAGEQVSRDRLGGQERSHAGQLGRGRILAGETVRDQIRGSNAKMDPADGR
jgi:hypothetical protein